MAKGSTYVRGLCIIFSILLGIFGVILLLFGIIANASKFEPVEFGSATLGVISCTGFGLATILLSLLGVYGAYREQVLALILYSVFMTIEFIVLLALALNATITQPQKERMVEDSFRGMIPLQGADDVFQRELNKLQSSAGCCGLHNYTDWTGNIPQSCYCPPDYPDRALKCSNVPRMLLAHAEWSNDVISRPVTPPVNGIQVYNKNCGSVILEYVRHDIRIRLGIIFTLITVMVAAVLVALLLLYKMYKRSTATEIMDSSSSRVKYELRPETVP